MADTEMNSFIDEFKSASQKLADIAKQLQNIAGGGG